MIEIPEALHYNLATAQRLRDREQRRQKRGRRIVIGLAVFYLATVVLLGVYARSGPPILPDLSVTPGAVRTIDQTDVCFNRSTKQDRHRSRARDDRILQEYGLPPGPHPDFEIDHLIPLDLGGADEDANLWPQPRRKLAETFPAADRRIWYAERKDRLERELSDLVCGGTISLAEAQGAIQKDWIEAYRKYVGANHDDEDGDDQLGTP